MIKIAINNAYKSQELTFPAPVSAKASTFASMDQPWDESYAPSECAKHPRWNASSDKPVSFNTARLQKNTRALKDIPYEPGLWLLRAQLLLALGYPELAAGDAYKARLLVEASRDQSSHLGAQVRLQYGMCIWLGWHHRWDPALGGLDAQFVNVTNVAEELASGLEGYEQQAWSMLIIALQHADCLVENQKLAQEAAQKFGMPPAQDTGPWSEDYQNYLYHLIEAKKEACAVHPELSEDELLMKKALLNGTIVIRQYPWMHSFLERSEKTRNQASAELTKTSGSQCVLGESGIQGADLGVFAGRSIPHGEEILVDRSYTAATSEPGRCPSCCGSVPEPAVSCALCGERFCSTDCLNAALSKFHPPLCGKKIDFSELEETDLVKHTARNPLAEVLVMMRFLAIAVQSLKSSQASHPLEVGEINQMLANYSGKTQLPWNFPQAIVLPIRILQSLEVDVFADHRFDTWVIQTISNRIQNNSAMGFLEGYRGPDAPCVQGVFMKHAFFNHSCDPNVTYEDHPSQAAQVLKAKRNVAGGEELYIAYDLGLDAEGMDVWKRREALQNWMGGDCKCTRCQVESEEMGDLVDVHGL